MSEFNDVKDGVLIVGAGPTGLTLACDLVRRGVPTLLVERDRTLFPGSRGKGLQPRTREVFDDLGVAEAVERVGGPYPRMLAWENGERLGEFDMVENSGPVPGAPYTNPWMVPQWRTQELLHERLRELGGEVEFGTALAGIEQDEHGVTAHLAHGDGPGTVPVRAAYLVACDGGRSTVRAAVGIGMTGENVDPDPIVVADVRLTGLDALNWHVWPKAPEGHLALCPLAGTDHFQLAAQNAAFDDPAHPEATVRELVAQRTHLGADAVKEVLWASEFRANAALADRFREGRVLLAGDAAHIHSPAGGQGLNTSVQDAYNLGWKLGRVLSCGAGPALLDSYEAERLPLAAEVLGLSTRLHRSGSRRRGPETQQLGIAYRDSPLSRELRANPGGTLRAGDRAPDAVCTTADGSTLRLFDAFRGPHFTLLALGGAQPPEGLGDGAHDVRTYAIADAEPHAREAYGTDTEALLLIRPDGYVALATDGGGAEPGISLALS